MVPTIAAPAPLDFDRAAAQAVAALRSIPDDQPVRLAKVTSNLFRGRSPAEHRLDLGAFTGVFSVDPEARTALVGGLTTYEDLVARTLPHGLVPLCVPQLRTITLGGAVTGMGIEAASFRNGCPHESVLSMDILTGDGQVVHAEPTGPHADLFHGFPNSYGSLGYALRLEIELEPAARYVELRQVPFGSVEQMVAAIDRIMSDREWDRERVDYLDGTVFSGTECYLTLGRCTDGTSVDGTAGSGVPCERRAFDEPSDYTGSRIYYQSIQRRSRDLLTTLDYLWRWDTDWFWCSRAFGTQRPLIRRLWPRRYKRSDVYWRLTDLNRRHAVADRLNRLRGRAPEEPVVQDIEVPLAQLPAFLDFFATEVGISPVWCCPLTQRDPQARWPLYQFDPERRYVNVGFWSTVRLEPGQDPRAGAINRRIEQVVAGLGGRKSLYSSAYYDRDEFYRTYGGQAYGDLKRRYDPKDRLTGLWEKAVGGG